MSGHLKRRCEGHDRSPITERLKANVMARYEWTCVWIANEVAMMSINIDMDQSLMSCPHG